MKVKAVGTLSDVQGLLVGVVLEDELLKEQERAFVVHSLADLGLGDPRVRSPLLLTVVALQVRDDKLDHKRLLEHSALLPFLLHG